jgi:hypothetical protein
MAVVQGQTVEECQYCIKGIAKFSPGKNWDEIGVRTLGIPKHLASTTSWEDIRTQLLRWALKEFPGVWDYHFLGYVREGELMQAAELGVRSLDTSAPFICTAENMKLNPREQWEYEIPKRQPDFADLGPEYFHPKLLRENIDILDRWSRYGTDDSSR